MNAQEKDFTGQDAPVEAAGLAGEQAGASAPGPVESVGAAQAPAPATPPGQEEVGGRPGGTETVGNKPAQSGRTLPLTLIGVGVAIVVLAGVLFGLAAR